MPVWVSGCVVKSMTAWGGGCCSGDYSAISVVAEAQVDDSSQVDRGDPQVEYDKGDRNARPGMRHRVPMSIHQLRVPEQLTRLLEGSWGHRRIGRPRLSTDRETEAALVELTSVQRLIGFQRG
jgi:hypothetical protein